MAQNNLTLTLQQLDDNGQTIARRIATVSDPDPTVGEYIVGNLPTTGQVTITLPQTQCRQVLVRNLHTSAKITVVWTPNGGAEVTVGVLGPGDAIGLWSQATGSTYGVSSLKLTSDTSNTPYELFIGG